MLGPRILMFGCWRYWGYYVMFCFHVMSFKGGKSTPPPQKKRVFHGYKFILKSVLFFEVAFLAYKFI